MKIWINSEQEAPALSLGCDISGKRRRRRNSWDKYLLQMKKRGEPTIGVLHLTEHRWFGIHFPAGWEQNLVDAWIIHPWLEHLPKCGYGKISGWRWAWQIHEASTAKLQLPPTACFLGRVKDRANGKWHAGQVAGLPFCQPGRAGCVWIHSVWQQTSAFFFTLRYIFH